ncbi:MAG: aminotransferase class III-fold pyridoxal phosphate-dependent enzyme, partial [Candidatus Eisenbacteria bacterium]|nr:aminotransferase class III-fold pyridoxal phosphate-dependent enzyme [Candidatus Eisenbacteria bacterium]
IKTTTVGQVAGFIGEPIQGVGGFITPPKEYFKIVAEIIRRYGGVFIADEVQTGFGRTGENWWGIEHYDVEPDIMTMAKGIGNGMPLAATIATAPIADSFKSLTISTYGGNPISCAAGNETIRIMEEENIPAHSKKLGAQLRAGLEGLQVKYPKVIGDVRGMGLMQAIEFVVDEPKGDRTPNPAAVGQLFEETKKRGLLIGKGGLEGNCLRISPPMSVTSEEIDEAIGIMDESFKAMGV